jgi:hypothetical protein
VPKWQPWSEHPLIVGVTLLATVVATIVAVLTYSRGTEPPAVSVQLMLPTDSLPPTVARSEAPATAQPETVFVPQRVPERTEARSEGRGSDIAPATQAQMVRSAPEPKGGQPTAGIASSDPGALSPPPAPRREYVRRSFQSGPLLLSIESVDLRETLLFVSLSAESSGPSMVSVLCTNGVLTDDRGGEWQLSHSAGLARLGPFNVTYSSSQGVAYPIETHTTFQPGVPQTAMLRFVSAGGSPRSITEVMLSMECYVRSGNWDQPFALSSPSLSVRSP